MVGIDAELPLLRPAARRRLHLAETTTARANSKTTFGNMR